MAKRDVAGAELLARPVVRSSIESLLANLERADVRVSLSGATLDIKAPAFGSAKSEIAELKERSLEAVGYLAGKRMPAGLPASKIFPRSRLMPLSVAQEALAHVERVPAPDQWLPFLWRMRGPLDVAVFSKAYAGMVERQEILRTRYVREGGEIRQEVLGADRFALELVDLTSMPAEAREMEIHRRLKAITASPPPLSEGALHLRLYRVAEEDHILGGYFHHVALDGRSVRLLLKELGDGYFSLLGEEGAPPPPKAPALQYADFALWENSWMTETERKLAAAWWEYKLGGAAPMAIPNGRKRGDAPQPGESVPFALPVEVMQRATACARANGVTLNNFFIAALSLVLGRYTGQSHALFGLMNHGRPPGFEEVIGCFMQVRPIYLPFGDDPTFVDLLARTRLAAAAVADQRKPVPYELMARLGVSNILLNYVRSSGLAEGAQPPVAVAAGKAPAEDVKRPALVSPFASPAHPPLNLPKPLAGAAGKLHARMTPLPQRLQTEFAHDLHFAITQTPGNIRGHITFAAERFEQRRIGGLSLEIGLMMAVACSAPELKVSSIMEAAVRPSAGRRA